MKPDVAARIRRLNHDFYDTFATEFGESRRVLQPGVVRALRSLGAARALLDIGCGDVRVARFLREEGRRGGAAAETALVSSLRLYVGVDASEALLARARELDPARAGFSTRVVLGDLTEDSWTSAARRAAEADAGRSPFDAAVCFSVLPQIPGAEARRALLGRIAPLLAPGARLALSTFRFLHLERFRERLVAPTDAGFDAGELEAGDHFLDWRRGGRGVRYYHHFEEEELTDLASGAGFDIVETYRSDGETGDLGLFVILRRGKSA